jgi:hypothetical protein
MSRAGSAVAASQGGDEPWLALDAAPKPLSKEDALARPDVVLQEAIARVTATHTASLRKRRGDAGGVDIGDLHVATYDRHQCALLLQDLTQASGMLTRVDANGDVREDYDKMNAFASDVLESCFASVPTEEEAGGLGSTNPMAAFQAVYKARAAREHIQDRCRAYVEHKTEEEVRLTRRLIRTARELHKPPPRAPKGGLVQAAFLVSRLARGDAAATATANDHVAEDDVEGGLFESASQKNGRDDDALVLDAPAPDASLAGAVAAAGFARSLVARARATRDGTARAPPKPGSEGSLSLAAHQKAGLLTTVDPYDDSVFGVTNRAIHLVRQNTRVAQTVLEYLLGYASTVDPEDLDDIEAQTSRGARAAEGKSLRELALKYAAHLDATLPERHKRVLTTLIREAAETHHARAALGADAEARYESRKHEGANDTARRNRDAWTRSMFPEAPWPKQSQSGGSFEAEIAEEAERALRDGAFGPPVGALVNPTDPRSGVVTFDGAKRDGGAPGSGARSSSRQTEVRLEPPRELSARRSVPGVPGSGDGGDAASRYSTSTGWGEEGAGERPAWLNT